VRRAREVADGQAARALEGREQVFTGLQKKYRDSLAALARSKDACSALSEPAVVENLY